MAKILRAFLFLFPLAIAVWSTTVSAARLDGWLEADTTRLTPHDLSQVERGIAATEKLELSPKESGPDYFAQLFGGNRGSDVVQYLQERIHFLGKDPDDTPDEAGTYAANYGPTWLEYIYKKEVLGHPYARPESAEFKKGKISISSPRTGLVVLGRAFGARATSDFDRMETLVHEARHSDCPARPSARDLAAYSKERYAEMSNAGRACTNVHMTCPTGHALAGDLACDAHPWGGYMVGYVFAEEVFKRCRNCSESERQQALVTAKEDFTRLTPELREGLKKGTLRSPVMDSIP